MTTQAPAQGDMSTPHEMKVLKRNLSTECISFDKVTKRIRSLSHNLCVDPTKVSQKVIEALFDGVSTRQIDELAAQISASMSLEHPHYNDLAGRIAVSNHQKNTTNSFFKTMKMLYEATDINGEHHPIISKELYKMATNHKKEIEDTIDYERDYLYDYFGFKTLEKSYLMRLKGQPVERIQHMWMRVSLAIHQDDLAAAFETYHLMSLKYFTHATPTLFNSGTPRPQLSSCFLLEMKGDSVPEIFQTLEQCAQISKWAGGIGLHVHNIRAKGSYIRGTNGVSNGLVPCLRVFNATSRYIDQCAAIGTRVYTSQGFKTIENIICNDLVLGGDGLYHKVIRVLEQEYTGEVINVEMNSESKMQITPTQQLLVARSYCAEQRPDVQTAEFISADDVLVGDFIVQSSPDEVQDIPEWSADDCYLLGLLLRPNSKASSEFTLQVLDEGSHDWVQSYLQNRLIPYDINAQMFTWKPNKAFPFTLKTTRDGLPQAALHLPKSKRMRILEGYGSSTDKLENAEYLIGPRSELSMIRKITSQFDRKLVYDLVLESSSTFMSAAGLLHQAIDAS